MTDRVEPVRVLVAEDDTALRRLIEMLLTNEGYEVRAVGDGTEALETIAGWVPEAIVLDVMMPKLSGLTVCRELRSAPEHAGIPIILLTARCFDEDIQAVLELGGITFMNKPFNPRQLMTALAGLVPDTQTRGTRTGADGERFRWLTPHKGEVPTIRS
jgi:CheY-like chemotaxis protein